MEKILIVLDSLEYKKEEQELYKSISNLCNPCFFYSQYENRLTEVFQKTKVFGGFLTHISYWLLSVDYALKLLFSRKFNRYNHIIFINPIVGIFYCLFSKCVFLKKNISVCGFLFEQKKSKLYLKLRTYFVNLCYKSVQNIFVYSENEVGYYEKIFPKLNSKFKYIKYGRDFCYKNVKDFYYQKSYIASGGRSNRNFGTLCSAMEILYSKGVEQDCLIATRPECVTEKMKKSPVHFLYGITLNQFGPFLKYANIFILPLQDTKLSAGHMAMLEALANNTPIIVTDIPAIRDYVSEKQVIFYENDNANDLANKILYVMKNIDSIEIKDKIENGKILYKDEYSFQALLKRIVIASFKKNQ
jgi:glycosyltransferase involved in cell wall biosynthesis